MFNYEIVYMKKRILLSLLAIILSFPAIRAQEYTPTPENLQARKTLQNGFRQSKLQEPNIFA